MLEVNSPSFVVASPKKKGKLLEDQPLAKKIMF